MHVGRHITSWSRTLLGWSHRSGIKSFFGHLIIWEVWARHLIPWSLGFPSSKMGWQYLPQRVIVKGRWAHKALDTHPHLEKPVSYVSAHISFSPHNEPVRWWVLSSPLRKHGNWGWRDQAPSLRWRRSSRVELLVMAPGVPITKAWAVSPASWFLCIHVEKAKSREHWSFMLKNLI